VVGAMLPQVAKAMTGNRPATSEHRAAWEAIVGSLGRIRPWRVCRQSRVAAARMRAAPSSPARSAEAP